MNTLSGVLALSCLWGVWGNVVLSSDPQDCQWNEWRSTGCKKNEANKYRVKKVRDKIPAENGGADCVGSDTKNDDCNEIEYVASTFLDTINSHSKVNSIGNILHTFGTRVTPPEFNPCTKPYLDTSKNPRMLGKPCKKRERRRRSADGNIEVYEEPLMESIRVKRQTTSSIKYRDILFLIDESESVGQNNFKKEVRLAKAIVSNWCGDIAVGEQATRVGIMGFNKEQHPMLDFNKLFEASEIITHMNTQVKYTSTDGATCLYDALKFTRTDMMSPKRGARGPRFDTEQVVVLITNGCTDCKNQGDFPTVLKNIRIKFEITKISFITLFIGNLSPSCKTTMLALADGSLCYQLFTASNWEELDAMSAHIEGRKCMDSWQIEPQCPVDIM